MNTAIAHHLNVTESAIIRVEEWANVIFTVVRGIGARFVSKKVVKMGTKQIVSIDEAAAILNKTIEGKIWNKKEGEVRIYKGQGYIRIAPETMEASQIQYFCKSYDMKSFKPSVEAFNALYTVSASTSDKKEVVMQEDEDGIIAPEGQHEPGVHIVREWIEYR